MFFDKLLRETKYLEDDHRNNNAESRQPIDQKNYAAKG